MYFHVRITLHHLVTSIPHEDGVSKVINSYIKSAYYRICDDYVVNADGTWVHGDWFYTTKWCFGDAGKATKSSPPDNLTRWLISQSTDFTRKGIWKISRSVRACLFSSYFSGPWKIKYSR